VERFFEERQLDEASTELKLIGARVVPYALAALNDPRTKTHAWHSDDITRCASALRRICWLLAGCYPPAAVAPLTRFTHHPNRHYREDAAFALAAIATADSVDGVARCWPMRTSTSRGPGKRFACADCIVMAILI